MSHIFSNEDNVSLPIPPSFSTFIIVGVGPYREHPISEYIETYLRSHIKPYYCIAFSHLTFRETETTNNKLLITEDPIYNRLKIKSNNKIDDEHVDGVAHVSLVQVTRYL